MQSPQETPTASPPADPDGEASAEGTLGEAERILEAYEARKSKTLAFYRYENLAHLLRMQERHRETLRLLRREGFADLGSLRILDLGCGDGNMLRSYLEWGARSEHLAGIELRPDAIAQGRATSPGLDLRVGSGTDLPWEAGSFDLVLLNTVFSSILDAGMRCEVVAEIQRVLRPQGGVVWYDFRYDNPRNPDVRGVKRAELDALFEGFTIHLASLSLAPPIARRLPEFGMSLSYPLLAALPFLRTHYLGFFRRP